MSKDPLATDETAFVHEALIAEADAIARLAERAKGPDASGWRSAIDLVTGCSGHVVVSGMGKSGLIGKKISATLSSLGRPSHAMHPAEAVHGDLGRVRRDDVALLLSYSGETEEVVALASILKADEVPTIGVSRSVQSSLGRLTTSHLSLGDIVEACPLNLAPTASTTAMLAVGDALALAAARRLNFDADAFQRRHPGGMLGVGLRPITEVLRFRVGDNLPVVRDDLKLGEALSAAGEGRRAGAILLVDQDGILSGIFTDGDLRRLINRDGARALETTISTIMTPRPEHLDEDALVRDAVRLIRERRIDEIPVLDHAGRPLGLVDVQDLIAMKVVRE
ncbi:MAG: KpsF/GutQ family sugar-phosphate isomerase [Phycisphaerales bacterium]|nr:KpsF/GutQ family sugar-phosphate isomerase [Phycisphaerales bacterium]